MSRRAMLPLSLSAATLVRAALAAAGQTVGGLFMAGFSQSTASTI
jgi:hypothetical protein